MKVHKGFCSDTGGQYSWLLWLDVYMKWLDRWLKEAFLEQEHNLLVKNFQRTLLDSGRLENEQLRQYCSQLHV